MSSKLYIIVIKTPKGNVTAKYKAPDTLETGEELFLYYFGKTNLVKIISVKEDRIEAEENVI